MSVLYDVFSETLTFVVDDGACAWAVDEQNNSRQLAYGMSTASGAKLLEALVD
jgi:hypothetical protein